MQLRQVPDLVDAVLDRLGGQRPLVELLSSRCSSMYSPSRVQLMVTRTQMLRSHWIDISSGRTRVLSLMRDAFSRSRRLMVLAILNLYIAQSASAAGECPRKSLGMPGSSRMDLSVLPVGGEESVSEGLDVNDANYRLWDDDDGHDGDVPVSAQISRLEVEVERARRWDD